MARTSKQHWWELEVTKAKNEGLGNNYSNNDSFKQLSPEDQGNLSKEASYVYDYCTDSTGGNIFSFVRDCCLSCQRPLLLLENYWQN